jgi:hypothetical protein
MTLSYYILLHRTMDFTAGLLRLLSKEMSSKMEELVEECYMTTLKPHHGWIASAAFKVYTVIPLILAMSYLLTSFSCYIPANLFFIIMK